MNKYIILLKIVRIVRFFYGLQLWPEIPVVSTNTDSFNKTVILWLLVLCEEVLFSRHISFGDACFLDLGTFFLDLYMFFGPNRIFLDLGSQKMWGTCLCVYRTLWGYFFWTCMYLCWTQGIFFDSQINCFWALFLFFGPVRLLRGPCLHRVGGNSIVIGAHIGLDVFGPWRLLFWNSYTFFWTWHRVGGI